MERLSGSGKLPTVSEDIIQKPVKYHNQVVGWVMSNAADKISREADINFDRQQHITSSLVTMFSLLLALITTFYWPEIFSNQSNILLRVLTNLLLVILPFAYGTQAAMN